MLSLINSYMFGGKKQQQSHLTHKDKLNTGHAAVVWLRGAAASYAPTSGQISK